MDDLNQRIANLSPQKRALLEQRLRHRSTSGATRQAIPHRDASTPCPLSFTQQRLWFLDQLVPGNPFYNEHAVVRLTLPLNVPALENSLNEIVRRHEACRRPKGGQQVRGEVGGRRGHRRSLVWEDL